MSAATSRIWKRLDEIEVEADGGLTIDQRLTIEAVRAHLLSIDASRASSALTKRHAAASERAAAVLEAFEAPGVTLPA